MSQTDDFQYKCRYWVREPQRCSKWDIQKICCTDPTARFYPYCNLLGTQFRCNKYDGDPFDLNYMCVRPDPSRTVPNRKVDSARWVNLPILDSKGEVIQPGNYDPISCYNNGECDGYGTCVTCSGFMPFGMAFSNLQPDDERASLGYDLTEITTTSGLVFRLPLDFVVYNLRAKLGRCYWWNSNSADFTVNSSGVIQKPRYMCTNSDEEIYRFNDFYYDKELNMYIAPCNGAKPECPHYTGICWKYCVDKYMRYGDYVSAEQILELRYYLRKDRWTKDTYYASFYEGDIYAWDGVLEGSSDDIKIPSHRVYFVDFDSFDITSDKVVLSAGTPAEGTGVRFPTLVRALKSASLQPIIRNVFDNLQSNETDASQNDKANALQNNKANTSQTNGNVFEVSDINHKYITIFGDQFYYDSDTYAFNLNDPELEIPSHIKDFLLTYDSLSEAKASLIETFEDLYDDYRKYIEFLIRSSPEHILKSTIGDKWNMFYIDALSFFGDNTIVVVNNGSKEWEFDKISFKKVYVGGVIGQTKFNIEGSGVVNYLPAYENSFMADLNKNGEVKFKFFYLTSQENTKGPKNPVVYTYLDGVKKRLNPSLSDPLSYTLWKMNYKLYKRKVMSDLELTSKEVRFFGNAGYALVILPDEDKVLTDVIKPWDIEDIKLCYEKDDEEIQVDMEVVDKCNDKLEINQCIIKPKDITKFSSVCEDTTVLKIKSVYIYERRTATESIAEPGYEEVREDFVSENDHIEYGTTKITKEDDFYSVKQFSDMPIVPAVVFRGNTGRIKGQVKTKLVLWVRQPYCRDVEIYYSWTANYSYYKLLPEYVKYGKTGIQMHIELVTRSYTPPCGDHDLSFFNLKGPMWYPYDACDRYDKYTINNNIVYDTGIMEVFYEKDSSKVKHGKHDIRMLGPADNFGEICGIHSTLWMCYEDWSYCNLEKKGDNIFSGYARYRGGLTYFDKLKALQPYGSLPKFGNVYRDFLRSVRALDNIDYYVWTGTKYIRKSKWVPMTEAYSIMDVNRATFEYPYLMYISNDFYNDKSMYIDQLGLLQALQIEGIDINEELVVDDNRKVIRFRFEDIFRPHWISGIYYPYPKKLYLKGTNLLPVISWYTYKNNPIGDNTKSIQWAWRERWKDLERTKIRIDFNESKFRVIKGHYINITGSVIEELLCAYYVKLKDRNEGRHLFLDVTYPPYKYDFMVKEHRLVCDEGKHEVRLYAPKISSDLSYDESDELIAWKLQLNDGPIRCFNINGEWVDQTTTSGACQSTRELYKTCTKDPWVSEVSLFDTGYTSTTPVDERTIITYNDVGDEIKKYYQRGLNVKIYKDRLDYLPYKLKLLDPEFYELKLSDKPSFGENQWSFTEFMDNFYPGVYDLNADYNCELDNISITLYNSKGISIGATAITFKVGAREGVYPKTKKRPIFSGDLYHVPAIDIYISDDDNNYELVYSDSMLLYGKDDELSEVNIFYEFSLDIKKKVHGSKYVKLVFRLNPTQDELDQIKDLHKYYKSLYVTNHVFIKYLYFYYIEFVDAVDNIVTYERKYAISIGKHGDFPPHGYESTGSLLYKLPSDSSTVYQMDSIYGVVGIPGFSGACKTMNKLRGRIMEKCHHDKEPITGPRDPHYYETLQKKIHDDIINKGNTTFTMKSCQPPFLYTTLMDLHTSFPMWECEFTNTYVRPLAPIVPYGTYSPCGHKFIPDFTTLRYVPCILCGHYMPVPCLWRHIYDRVFIRACDENFKQKPNWAVVAYYQGTANVLIRPFEYFLAPTIARFENVSYLLNSWSGTISMFIPEGVSNLY